MNKKLLLLTFVVLSACIAQMEHEKFSTSIFKATEQDRERISFEQSSCPEQDKFSELRLCKSQTLITNNPKIRVFLSKDSNDRNSNTYMAVIYSGKDWIFGEKAIDSNKKDLNLNKGNRNVRHGGVTEIYIIDGVTLDYLREHLEKDMSIRISGSHGNEDFIVPSGFIRGFYKFMSENSMLP